MSLPKLNDPLIEKVLKHIKAFPVAYNQNEIVFSTPVTEDTPCGAIGCFGGWAVLLTNPVSKRHKLANSLNDAVVLGEAQELLGLTTSEADYLFDAATGNAKKDLKIIEKRLKTIRAARSKVAKSKLFQAAVKLYKIQEEVEAAQNVVDELEAKGKSLLYETSEGDTLCYADFATVE